MKALLVCVLLAVVFVSFSSAVCRYDEAKEMKHKWSDKVTYYCVYDNIKFGAGSRFTDLNRCMQCYCTPRGLSCCGMGESAGTIRVPGCVADKDVCEMVLLNEKKTELCFQ